MVNFQKSKSSYLLALILSVILGIVAVTLLYLMNLDLIIDSYNSQEGALGVLLIISFRILIVAGMAIYTFFQWFKQEEQYFSDIPFLFGLFFLLLIFGKLLDLFNDFVYHELDEDLILLVFKTRYIIAILDLLPMIYLSLNMILFSLSIKKKTGKLTNEKSRNQINLRLLVIIFVIELIVGVVVPSITILTFIYPLIIIPSLLTIVWLFNFAWRNKRLSQVNTYILMIGFSLYLISSILRPVIQLIIGESSLFIIIAEFTDLILFIVIFFGFYKRSNL